MVLRGVSELLVQNLGGSPPNTTGFPGLGVNTSNSLSVPFLNQARDTDRSWILVIVLVQLSEGSWSPNMVTNIYSINPEIGGPGSYIRWRPLSYLGGGLRVSMMSGEDGRPGRRSELSGAEHWSCRPLAGPARPEVL